MDYTAIVAVAVSLLFGSLSSLIAWWLLFRMIRPRLAWSSHIALSPADGYYRVRITNVGRRDIAELTATALFRAPVAGETATAALLDLPLAASGISLLTHRASRQFRFRTDLLDTVELGRVAAAGVILRTHNDGSLDIRDTLIANTNSLLRLYVHGADNFSGARRVFPSPDYLAKDIQAGHFVGTRNDKNGAGFVAVESSIGSVPRAGLASTSDSESPRVDGIAWSTARRRRRLVRRITATMVVPVTIFILARRHLRRRMRDRAGA